MKVLKNNRGSAYPLILIILFFILSVISAIYQNQRAIVITRQVKAAMQKSTYTAITRNSEETYSSKREGFGGAYEKQTDWNSNLERLDIESHLTETLKLTKQGDVLVKVNEYEVRDVLLLVTNAEKLNKTDALKVKISLNLSVPIKFGGLSKTVVIPLSVSSKNLRKY